MKYPVTFPVDILQPIPKHDSEYPEKLIETKKYYKNYQTLRYENVTYTQRSKKLPLLWQRFQRKILPNFLKSGSVLRHTESRCFLFETPVFAKHHNWLVWSVVCSNKAPYRSPADSLVYILQNYTKSICMNSLKPNWISLTDFSSQKSCSYADGPFTQCP